MYKKPPRGVYIRRIINDISLSNIIHCARKQLLKRLGCWLERAVLENIIYDRGGGGVRV